MIGGKLLSEGGYGCVYHPYLNCNLKEVSGSKGKKYISKLQRHNKAAKNEIKIGNIVKEIDGYDNFFSPITDSCVVTNIGSLKNSSECSILSKKNKSNQYLLMKLPHAGNSTFLDYLLDNTSSDKELTMNIITSYTYLVYSIELLHQKNIIHYDIKGGNIMFNERRNTPVIIDFGLSIDMTSIQTLEDLSDSFYIYAPDYYLWTPEQQYLSYVSNIESMPTSEEMNSICNDIVDNNIPLNKICSPEFVENYKQSLRDYISTLVGLTPMEVFDRVKEFSNTWDNYSLSIMFLKLFEHISSDGFTNNPFIVFFIELLLQNIHPNPSKRLSPRETIVKFNDYQYRNLSTKNDYRDFIESFTKNRQTVFRKMLRENQTLDSLMKDVINAQT